jgi:hypothetical protein
MTTRRFARVPPGLPPPPVFTGITSSKLIYNIKCHKNNGQIQKHGLHDVCCMYCTACYVELHRTCYYNTKHVTVLCMIHKIRLRYGINQ